MDGWGTAANPIVFLGARVRRHHYAEHAKYLGGDRRHQPVDKSAGNSDKSKIEIDLQFGGSNG